MNIYKFFIKKFSVEYKMIIIYQRYQDIIEKIFKK